MTKAELIQLEAGGLVLPAKGHKNPRGTSFIEATLVFDRPPDEVWRLLSETEAQHRYLAEIRSLQTIWKSEARHCLEFTVKALSKPGKRVVSYLAAHPERFAVVSLAAAEAGSGCVVPFPARQAAAAG